MLNGTTWVNNTYNENGTKVQPYAWLHNYDGNGTNTLYFKYIVQPKDNWNDGYLNYAGMHSLELGEGVILDTDAVSGYGPASLELCPACASPKP